MIKFRNDLYSNSRVGIVHPALELFVHEYLEQTNTHIIDYALDTEFISNNTKKKLTKLSDILKENTFNPKDKSFLAEIKENFKSLLDEYSKHYGFPINYALYLGSLDCIINEYEGGIDDDANISAYEDSPALLADLDPEGQLYGYEKKPEPIAAYLTKEDATLINKTS